MGYILVEPFTQKFPLVIGLLDKGIFCRLICMRPKLSALFSGFYVGFVYLC